jgi:hypothetical protein
MRSWVETTDDDRGLYLTACGWALFVSKLIITYSDHQVGVFDVLSRYDLFIYLLLFLGIVKFGLQFNIEPALPMFFLFFTVVASNHVITFIFSDIMISLLQSLTTTLIYILLLYIAYYNTRYLPVSCLSVLLLYHKYDSMMCFALFLITVYMMVPMSLLPIALSCIVLGFLLHTGTFVALFLTSLGFMQAFQVVFQ